VKRVLFLFVCVLPIQSSWGSDNRSLAVDYLNKMGMALHSLDYYGALVYSHDSQIETMQLIHKKDANGEHERLVHTSGAEREVVRKGDMVTCYLSDSQSVLVGKRRFNSHLLAKLRTDFTKFTDTYSFEADGKDRVAGRKARIILIKPKDNYRYGYRLWIDEDSHLLLKSELVDEKQKVLEQMMFANLNVVDDIPDAKLQPAINGESYTWHEDKAREPVNAQLDEGWQLRKLPNGFSVTGHFMQNMPNSKEPVEHMVISDGLASISVYIEKFNADNKNFIGVSRMGAIHINGSLKDNYKITVVGEVPAETVQLVADSVNHQAGEPVSD
jgi:sigma-E factor negative regulatory protein RseB